MDKKTVAGEIPCDITSDGASFVTAKPETFYNQLPDTIGNSSDVEVIGPVSIIKPTTAEANFTNYFAPDMRLNIEKKLVLSDWTKAIDDRSILKNSELYVIRTTGTYEKKKNRPDQKVSNCYLEITSFEHCYSLDPKNNFNATLTVFVKGFAHVSTGKNYRWSIELEKYKNLFSELVRKHGDISLSKNVGDGVDVYLSDLYADAITNGTPVSVTVDWNGWYEIDDTLARYYIGKKNTTSSLANLEGLDRARIVSEGLQYLKIGYAQKEIAVLFMFIHAGFANFWFKKAGLGWNMCLVVQGITNSGKTSVLEVSADILNSDRKAGLIQLGSSTDAGARRILNTLFRDTFCCYDDFSNADERTSRNAHNLVEAALRLIGDDSGRIKAGTGLDVVREHANCVLAVTAEESFRLGASSHSRYLTIFLQRGMKNNPSLDNNNSEATLDFRALAEFKNHPEILHRYFTLFIEYLTEKGYNLVTALRENIYAYRQKYSTFSIGRLVDAAVRLNLQADIIEDFIIWSGLPVAIATSTATILRSAIVAIVKTQETLFEENTPSKVFLKALVDCFDLNKQLAATEEEYIYSHGLYIGFRDCIEGTVWLNKESVESTVLPYIASEGLSFRVQKKNIPKLLFEDGYSKAIITYKDGRKKYTYLPRSRKGTSEQRRGMYVLFETKLKEFYEED